jgi:hypothetical protein
MNKTTPHSLPPLPTFENPDDEIAFWESQDWTPIDQVDDREWDKLGWKPEISNATKLPKDRGLTIRFTEPTLRMLKYAANRRGLSVGALARMWLLEKLAEEEPN